MCIIYVYIHYFVYIDVYLWSTFLQTQGSTQNNFNLYKCLYKHEVYEVWQFVYMKEIIEVFVPSPKKCTVI